MSKLVSYFNNYILNTDCSSAKFYRELFQTAYAKLLATTSLLGDALKQNLKCASGMLKLISKIIITMGLTDLNNASLWSLEVINNIKLTPTNLKVCTMMRDELLKCLKTPAIKAIHEQRLKSHILLMTLGFDIDYVEDGFIERLVKTPVVVDLETADWPEERYRQKEIIVSCSPVVQPVE